MLPAKEATKKRMDVKSNEADKANGDDLRRT